MPSFMAVPTLQADILDDIVLQLYDPNNEFETLKSFKKFMQSGKEPYEAVMNYFSHVNSVTVHDDHLTIYVERSTIVKEEIKVDLDVHEIPYSFSYFPDIRRVVAKSNKVLVIEHYPPVKKGQRALAMLTHKDLKSITFSNYNIIPAGYYKFVKDQCKLDETYLVLNGISQTTLDQYFSISLPHYTIITYLNANLWEENIEGEFPDVKSLCLLQCTYFVTESISSPEDVYNFLNTISKRLPNLEYLEVYFDIILSINDKWNALSWSDVYTKMVEFDPAGFSNISSKIKGSLNFYVYEIGEKFESALKECDGKVKVDVDKENEEFIKSFEIHDGFAFEFILKFIKKEKWRQRML